MNIVRAGVWGLVVSGVLGLKLPQPTGVTTVKPVISMTKFPSPKSMSVEQTRQVFVSAILASATLPLFHIASADMGGSPLFSRRRARVVKVEESVKPETGSLELQVTLPSGAHFTRGSPSRWRAVDPEGVAVAGGVLDEGRGVITMRDLKLEGPSTIELESAVFYCAPDNGGVGEEACRLDAAIFRVPVAAQGSGENQVKILQQVTPLPRRGPSNSG